MRSSLRLAVIGAGIVLSCCSAMDAEQHGDQSGQAFKPLEAVCDVAGTGETPELVAIELAPGQNPREACPIGSVYTGFKTKIKVVPGEPPLKKAPDESQAGGEGK